MCRIDDAERPEFCTTKLRQARKAHICGECGRTIKRAEQYEFVFGKWYGELSHHKTCLHCVNARKWLKRECSGYVYGSVREDLREHWDEDGIHTRELATLIWSMGRKWTTRTGPLMAIPNIKEGRP